MFRMAFLWLTCFGIVYFNTDLGFSSRLPASICANLRLHDVMEKAVKDPNHVLLMMITMMLMLMMTMTMMTTTTTTTTMMMMMTTITWTYIFSKINLRWRPVAKPCATEVPVFHLERPAFWNFPSPTSIKITRFCHCMRSWGCANIACWGPCFLSDSWLSTNLSSAEGGLSGLWPCRRLWIEDLEIHMMHFGLENKPLKMSGKEISRHLVHSKGSPWSHVNFLHSARSRTGEADDQRRTKSRRKNWSTLPYLALLHFHFFL